MKGKVTAACPTNIGSKGILSRWRTLSKGLSNSDRTGFLRRRGPVIEVHVEALMRRKGKKNGRLKPEMVSPELESQPRAASSPRASRSSDRTQRRLKEREARVVIREKRLIEGLLERQLNPIEDGNASRLTTTFSALQSWRQRGRASAEVNDENFKNSKEKPQESREDSRFTGVVVGTKDAKIKRKINRVESDGILLVVPARINGKLFTALIDSGATRCFVTPECTTIAGLTCKSHDTFLELGNGARALSRGMVQGAPITLAGVTSYLDLTVTKLLHEVDIVLGINWLKHINPLIDWCSGRVYLPGAINTALLEGQWLSSDHAIGTVKLLSTSDGLESIKNESVKNSISVLRTPQFWQAVNLRTNFSKGDVKNTDDQKRSCNRKDSKLFIQKDVNFGHLYIKKLRNSAAIPKRATENAAGYDLASAEETVVPAKGKAVVKTGISLATPEGCYGRIAPRSGLAVKRFIDVGAGVIDADYRGEVGVVLFNHSDEDFKVKQGDRIAQLILEKIDTPEVKETADLPSTVRGSKGYGSTGLKTDEKTDKDSSRVSVMQRIQGVPKIKRTNACRMQREFVSMKKMQKLMKQREHVFLCIIKAEDPSTKRRRRTRGSKKSKSVDSRLSNIVAQDSHGTTEKTKREHSKAVGPTKDFKTVEETTKDVVSGVAKEHQAKLRTILAEYRDVFRDELPKGPPPKREVAHSIEVQPGSEPTYRTPYRLRPAEQDELEEQVKDLLAQGFIRPSQSPYGAPVLFVPKKDGRWRMCIDYRALNRQTVKDRYPLPRIDTLLDRLGHARIFTKLDLASGYHQIAMEDDSIYRTAFTTSLGQWEFLVMPFGLCNAPATFQRLMNRVFETEINKFILVYLDDILIFSETVEDHWRHLETALERLRKARLYGRMRKCDFLKTRVDYLGYEVSEKGVHASPEKVKAVVNWPRPQSVHDIRSFLGLASYYRRFIHGFSQIAGPLTELTRSKAKWRWESAQENSFLALKISLATAPVLRLPDFEHQFVVTTDASDVAIGAILQQDVGMGLQPIAFASRKLQQAEVRYSAYERELLGIVWALGQWKHYFQGPHPIIIQTDHAPLRHLPNQASVNSRIWKWLSILQGYHIDIQHIPGKRNPADSLSRQSVEDALVRKTSVHDANAAYVQKLRVPENATDAEIQSALTRLFSQNSETENQSVIKMTVQDSVQVQENLLNQFKPENKGQDQVQESDQSKISSENAKLAVLRSGVIIDEQFKREVHSLLLKESPYKEILEELSEGRIEVQKNDEKYKMKRGMLVVHRKDQDVELDYWRTVIPDDIAVKNFVVTELHAVPYSLHPGVHRTLQKVRRHFYWKGMTGNVRQYVESCPICQTEKADHTLTRGKLQSTQIPDKKWSEVSLDFITDLPVTRSKKDAILTVVDKATRMVHLIPCRKSITAAETAKLYWDNVVKLHGIPAILYSDRGTQFTSQFWKSLWELTGTQLRFSTAYHPQTQGVVERMNSVVGQMLRCIIHENRGSAWDSLLPTVELTINSLPNSSTGYSPFFLNYGYHPVLPVEMLRGDEEIKIEAVENFVLRVKNEWENAKKNLLKSVQKQQLYYNKKHRMIEYEVGDLVLLSSRNLNFKNVPVKLQQKFVGPFEIVEKIGPQAYKLQLPENWNIHNVFHISLLKRWKTSMFQTTEEPTAAELNIEDRQKNIIERILRKKKTGRGQPPAYLILWEGYPPEEATWEPATRFEPAEFQRLLDRDQPPEEKDNERGRSF